MYISTLSYLCVYLPPSTVALHPDISKSQATNAQTSWQKKEAESYPNTRNKLAFSGCMRKHDLRRRWVKAWAKDPAQRNQSSSRSLIRFHPAYLQQNDYKSHRKTFSRVLQCRIGRARLGSYYAEFVPKEDRQCPCGKPTQTREHILADARYLKITDTSATERTAKCDTC
ncbi:hypothetical protein BS47DRAFT_36448 [Hydnum rufescens UP504]|uniref:Uncharacterized protein n=1 Tax=Hydnum rufescens UP504 TaxID=1448309 RepID=A0A9P6ARV3_9AGAM|nr:hypothetical protein BS47DRAFT_36448 [Hydnum rufescens UP504]